MKLVKMPALRTGCLYPSSKIFMYSFLSVRGWVNSNAIARKEGLWACSRSGKYENYVRDLGVIIQK
jgi:hypothetical protein